MTECSGVNLYIQTDRTTTWSEFYETSGRIYTHKISIDNWATVWIVIWTWMWNVTCHVNKVLQVLHTLLMVTDSATIYGMYITQF